MSGCVVTCGRNNLPEIFCHETETVTPQPPEGGVFEDPNYFRRLAICKKGF